MSLLYHDAMQALEVGDYPKVIECVKQMSCDFSGRQTILFFGMNLLICGNYGLLLQCLDLLVDSAIIDTSVPVSVDIVQRIFDTSSNICVRYVCALYINHILMLDYGDQSKLNAIKMFEKLDSEGMYWAKLNIAIHYENLPRWLKNKSLIIFKSMRDIVKYYEDVIIATERTGSSEDPLVTEFNKIVNKHAYTMIASIMYDYDERKQFIHMYMETVRRNRDLELENLELKYAPNGVGYEEARDNFYTLMSDQISDISA